MRIAVAKEVPRGVDERVHRVSFSASGRFTLRAARVYELWHTGKRRLTRACKVGSLREHHRELIIGDRDHAALLAINDRHRRAPKTLAGYTPVADAIRHGRFSKAVLLCKPGHLRYRYVRQFAAPISAINQHSVGDKRVRHLDRLICAHGGDWFGLLLRVQNRRDHLSD